MADDKSPQEESWHAAADAQKCREMAQKYGWRLKRVDQTSNSILPVSCVFQGKTNFPQQYDD